MKAAMYTQYGAPEVVQVKEVERPKPKKDEVLIKVYSSTVNRTDCGFRSANYIIVRLFSGLFRPKRVLFPVPSTRQEDLDYFKELATKGALIPVIDRSYKLEEIVEAYRYVETGQKVGNVVLEIN